jgi:hypothetical protein
LKGLPKHFDLDTIDMKKGWFPFKFDKPRNWNYIGPFPALEYFTPNEKSKEEANDMTEWHSKETGSFNFRQEMFDYCLLDVRVLLSALQGFIKDDLKFISLTAW